MPRTNPTAALTMLVAAGFAAPVIAGGPMTLVSAARSVDGFGAADDGDGLVVDDPVEISTAGFGAFDVAVSGSVLVGESYGAGGGSQETHLEPGHVRGEASMFANGESWGGGKGVGEGSGHSNCTVVFELAAETRVRWHIEAGGFDSGWAEVRLWDPAGVFASAAGINDWERFEGYEVLPAGSYRVDASMAGSAFGDAWFADYASGSWSFEFLALRDGDADGDGSVGFTDILAVLAQWGTVDQSIADIDLDGDVDFDDLVAVLANFD